jgi:hypothetical protein
MVAGIVIHATGSELTVEHPTDPATLGAALLILGGPALFLLGHALFKQALWGHVATSRLVAASVLLALVPLAPMLSNLVLTVAARWCWRRSRRGRCGASSAARYEVSLPCPVGLRVGQPPAARGGQHRKIGDPHGVQR